MIWYLLIALLAAANVVVWIQVVKARRRYDADAPRPWDVTTTAEPPPPREGLDGTYLRAKDIL